MPSPIAPDASRSDHATDLVRRHQVRYELFARSRVAHEERATAGYIVELHALHDGGHTRLLPGCDRCVSTYKALLEITRAVAPINGSDLALHLSPFDASLRMSPTRGPEVLLTLTIEAASSASGGEALRESIVKIRRRLADIGVKPAR
jgi:hypothetical protein